MKQAPASIRAALKGEAPTEEQWEAITHDLEHLHLIAGAGSGKTAIMAARIVWIVEQKGYSPTQILGLTFTNKAAEELDDRVHRALEVAQGHHGEFPLVQTYHSFAAGIVREHGLLAGVEPDSGLLTEAQQWQLVLACIDELPAFEAIELRSGAGIVRATLMLAGSLADHIKVVSDVEAAADRVLSSNEVIEEEIRTAAAQRKELCRAVSAYQQAKMKRHRIDFGDQVTKAVEILENHPDIASQYRERFPIVLLDEYQDTNVAQRRLIQALVGDSGIVTAVGDARQAIYAFRGATMYNLIGFPNHFERGEETDFEPRSLSESFRCGAKILAVANRVVERIDEPRRPGKPMRPHPPNGEGRVSLGLFADERAEAEWIAAECETLYGTTTAPLREPVTWRDIAILVRRKAAMDHILSALQSRDIPVEVVGLGGLLKTPEVLEVVSWLRCLETRPAANRWLARVLLGPRWRIHYRDLALCARWAAEQNLELRLKLAGGDEEMAREQEPGDVAFSLIEALNHLDQIPDLGVEAKRRLNSFCGKLDQLRKKSGTALLDLVQEVLQVSGTSDALESSSARSAPAAKQNIANFLDQVTSFSPVEGDANLRSFLSYLDAAEDAEETLEATQPAEQDSVKLMTVHAAKGLEFECVFVPSVAASRNRDGNFVYSIFPNTRSSNPLVSYTELPYEIREDSEFLPRWTGRLSDFSKAVKERAVEDERRLFYVALTRAKQYLAVSAAWWYGRDKREKGPSQFWTELKELAKDGLVEMVAEADQPDTNPLIETLEGQRSWPPAPRAGVEAGLFKDGWGVVADRVVSGQLLLDDLVTQLDEESQKNLPVLITQSIEEVETLAAAAKKPESSRRLPSVLAATKLIDLLRGKVQPIEVLRPLLERPNAARRFGTEIHRLIEDRMRESGRWMPALFAEEEELDDPADTVEATLVRQVLDNWEKEFADRRIAALPSGELMVELPFVVKSGDRLIRGRIDAVFEIPQNEGGGLEIVDFKSGGRVEESEFDQLALYAAALSALGVPIAGPLRLTYFYLRDGEKVSREIEAEQAVRLLEGVSGRLASL